MFALFWLKILYTLLIGLSLFLTTVLDFEKSVYLLILFLVGGRSSEINWTGIKLIIYLVSSDFFIAYNNTSLLVTES